VLLSFVGNQLKAQLRFPKGNVLNLNTSEEVLYIETQIKFNTGKFKATDYNWEKKLDSLDSRWLVSACFNGDCKNDLLQSGTFIKDFGLNDTTCFIAFHVDTYELPGTSKIVYQVYNKNNNFDYETLVFNISYSKPTGINQISDKNLSIYPNPVSNKINIQSGTDLQNATIKIVNALGEEVLVPFLNNYSELDVSNLKNGIYFLNICSNNQYYTKKFIKQQ
jgi:hypothetical protein